MRGIRRILGFDPGVTVFFCLTLFCFLLIDIPISQFSIILQDGPIVKTSKLFPVRVGPHDGTKVQYRWELEDEELVKTQKVFFHVYNHPGAYTIHVTAYNRNNTVNSSTIVIVQDEIKGLKCVQSSIAVVPMEETVIEWVIFKGNIIFL